MQSTADARPAVAGPDRPPAAGGFVARVVLALALTGGVTAAFTAGFLAAYPAFIKFSPGFLATLAVPVRLSKTLEFAIYVVVFGVALPLSIAVADRFAARVERRSGDASIVAAANILALAAIFAAARIALTQAPPLISPDRVHWVRPVAMAVFAALLALAAIDVAIARRPPGYAVPAGRRVPLLVAACALTGVVFLPHNALTATSLAAAAVAAALVAVASPLARRVRVGGGHGRLWEALAVVVVALLAWDTRMPTGVLLVKNAHYWNVYTGPANALLHGGAMFVDVFAQYGAGTYYLLAGVFAATSPGYGTFLITLAVVDTLLFLAVYTVVRLARGPRLLAFAIACSAALTSILAGDTLITNRGLRLLVPLAAVLCVQLRERSQERRARYEWAVAALVALSSILAAEVFFYTLAGTAAGLAASFRAAAPEGRAFRVEPRVVGRIVGVTVAAQLVFAVCTRIFGGGWPQWLTYLEFQHYYVSGAGSQMTRTFGPGVLLGIGYFVSAAAIIGLFLWSRPLVRRRPVELVSLTAVVATAIAFYSYMVGEAIAPNLHKMAPLALLVAGLWLVLAVAEWRVLPRPLGPAIAFLTVWLVLLTFASDRAWLGTHVAHTGLNPPQAVRDLRHAASQPRATPDTETAERFVRSRLGSDPRLLLLLPDYVLPTELLMRLQKGSLLPISDPYEESFLPARRARLRELAAELPVGTRFVTTADYLASSTATSADLDAELLSVLKARYRLAVEASGARGLRVYRIAGTRS